MNRSIRKSPQLRSQALAAPVANAGWRFAIAGGLSGMFTNSLLHPLDTLKTVRQYNTLGTDGLVPTLFAILRTRGAVGLYAGIIPALIGSTATATLYFGFYELAKRTISRNFPTAWNDPRTRIPLTSLSAACGNVSSSFLYVPKEVLKQRLQSGIAGSAKLPEVASQLYQTAGILGFYRGYRVTLLRNIPSAMVRFAAFEEFKGLMRRLRRDGDTSRPMTAPELIASGSMAGALSSTLTCPMDVLKTRLAMGVIRPGTPLPKAFQQIVRSDGFQGLFAGVRPRVLWSAMFSAIGFTSYELAKAWLTGQPTRFWPSNMPARRVDSSQGRQDDKA